MNELVLIGILLLGGVAIAYAKKHDDGTAGMQDNPVSLDNIRKGVSRGWYKARLTRVNGQPAIYLYGYNTNGQEYGDTYPISQADWDTLKAEGYDVAQ